MNSVLRETNLAISELRKGNQGNAQELFRRSARNKPCCTTLNNLGVYYCQYGMLLKNGRIQSALQLGIKCLLKASTEEHNWINHVNIGTAMAEANRVSFALRFFSIAYEINRNPLVLYNIGVCQFRLGMHQKAADTFGLLCNEEDIEQILDNGGQNPLLILAFCCWKLNKLEKCYQYVNMFRKNWPNEERYDVFSLRCFCHKYEAALSECNKLLDEWYPTNTMLAMISDCVQRTGHSAHNFSIPEDWEKLWKKLNVNDSFRIKQMENYAYFPPFVCMYHFIESRGN